jgi:hypothetical protein
MRSSISNSNDRIPPRHWGRTWAMTLALTAGSLVGAEIALRCAGYEPSVLDDPMLWAVQRDKVHHDDSSQIIVLLGGSRILVGFVPEVFERHYPHYRVYQLALDGRHPMATLRDLAEDENFHGIVICSITTRSLIRTHIDDQKENVEYYHHVYGNLGYLDKALNRHIATLLQERLAFFNGNFSPSRVMDHLAEDRRMPRPFHTITRGDRFSRADYSKVDDIAGRRAYRIDGLRRVNEQDPPPTPEQWLRETRKIEPWVSRIQQRGGKVVFVRFITTDEYYGLHEKYWPKREYWDRFAANTQATSIHFMDVPELQDFHCPDTSHLNYPDAVRYTKALAQELERRKVIVATSMDH